MSNAGRPPKWTSPEELQKEIDAYFDEIKANEDIPAISELAYFLEVDRSTIVNYGKKDEFFHTIKRARQRVEIMLEKSLQTNSVTGTIFNLKNNFGWKDKTETELSGGEKPIELKWIVEVIEPSE